MNAQMESGEEEEEMSNRVGDDVMSQDVDEELAKSFFDEE